MVEIQERLAAHDARNPERPAAPFAINLIVHKSNDRLEHDLAICVKHRVPIIITSLGARPEVNQAVHSYGGHVLHDVINQNFARKAVEKGADGLVLVAAGAGGHAGSISPFALAAGDARLVRRAARPLGRDLARRVHPRGRGDGRGFRLYRQRLHRHHRSPGGRGAQADGRGARGRRHRLHQRSSPACTATT